MIARTAQKNDIAGLSRENRRLKAACVLGVRRSARRRAPRCVKAVRL
jgi:hypothetical protein